MKLAVPYGQIAYQQGAARGGKATPTTARFVYEVLRLHEFNLNRNVVAGKPFSAAWDVPSSWDVGSDCISGARFAEAVLKQLGVSASIGVKMYIPDWVENIDNAIEGSLAYVTRGGDGESPYQLLRLYGEGGGENNFEATVVASIGGTDYYMPSGVRELADGKPVVFDSANKVLTIFKTLSWFDDLTKKLVEPAVKTYVRAATMSID